jgi:hypothetical protein
MTDLLTTSGNFDFGTSRRRSRASSTTCIFFRPDSEENFSIKSKSSGVRRKLAWVDFLRFIFVVDI